MALSSPRICCLDLDTFFVSVERLLNPALEGKPVVVGGKPGQRGVVTACSYEVRRLGVHSGMSLTKAYELAPGAIFIPGQHGVYGPYSEQVRDIARDFSPVIRVASIDEMFIDFGGCELLYQKPEDTDHDQTIHRVVLELQARIKRETGLPASAGIATSKPVAKIASGLAKPAGVLLVPAGTEETFLEPLPVRKFPGIGPVAEGKLAQVGITTLGQLANTPDRSVRRIFGAWTDSIRKGVHGMGSANMGRDRPAFREHDPEGEVVGSISNERTFREDVGDHSTVESMLCGLCERVCWRARKRGVKARTVTLKLRYADFKTITRARTLAPTYSELELFPAIMDLYHQARQRSLKIRLLGIELSNLGFYDDQLSLFATEQPLHTAVDSLRQKYGYDSVRLATGRSRVKGSGKR